MNAEAGQKARAKKLKPYKLESTEQLMDMPPFPFPYMGDETVSLDEKYERVDSLFVDATGFGGTHEPALTHKQFREKLKQIVDEHGIVFLAIESAGQFQLHVGVWKERQS